MLRRRRISCRVALLACLSALVSSGAAVAGVPVLVATWEPPSSLFVVDSVTGELAPVGSAEGYVRLDGLTVSGDTVYGLGSVYDPADPFPGPFGNLYTIDLETGTANFLFSMNAGGEGAIAAHPSNGLLYAVSGSGIREIDPAGSWTYLGSLAYDVCPSPCGTMDISGLTYVGDTLYGVDSMPDSLVTIDVATLTVYEVGPLGHELGGSCYYCPAVASLVYDGANLLLVEQAGESGDFHDGIFTVDTSTGAATLQLDGPLVLGNFFFPPNIGAATVLPVPEPGFGISLGGGLMVLIALERWRRRERSPART